MLGQQKQDGRERIFLSLKDGQIERSVNGKKDYFTYVEGQLREIHKVKRSYNGDDVIKWAIELEDEEGELYTMTFPYSSGGFKSIILAIASFEGLTKSTVIKILAYRRGNFTNVATYADGIKLDWIIKELPPVETVTVGMQTVKDESKRMNLIESLVLQITGKLENGNKVIQ